MLHSLLCHHHLCTKPVCYKYMTDLNTVITIGEPPIFLCLNPTDSQRVTDSICFTSAKTASVKWYKEVIQCIQCTSSNQE